MKNYKWVDVKLVFIILFFSKALIAQKPIDDSVVNRIVKMKERDQEYRRVMLGSELWKKFKSQPQSYQDSINKLIKKADSINYDEFIEILNDYGYIDKYKNKSLGVFSLILLHNISANKVEWLQPILLKEIEVGKMPPLDYAQWYDRYLLQVCKKKELYGEYGRIGKFPCVEDLEATNEARKKIGLPPFKKSKCNEKH